MKPIAEVYEADRRSWYDYGPLLESLGYQIALQVDDDDYQGDSRLLLRDHDRWGVLIFGWGSCGGCDALQACDTLEEVEKLRSELHDQIVWFDSDDEAAEWFRTHDWEAMSWHDDQNQQFRTKGLALVTAPDLQTYPEPAD